ncbi:Glucosamine-6-phosphate deaminase 1 [Paraliobacillus sp. PM-2]|uniref:glucosamine-6-phosphate isomerase n=1 Tax=Paraliobacillus sp. PM-2 TaxID=1462524 RepID=UPI00061CD297|nr:glucosamine-6-phosphate isomerase [Paraliobacillus sp. PM-2]CQR47414.1 Glucosamine-6-phosphate deaminase 1 [Paraliobacillus sp. PM-2]
MNNDFYNYSEDELVSNPKIPLIVMEDNEEVFQSIAEEMVEEIERKNEQNDHTVFIVPVGPVGQYPYFVDIVNQRNVSLKNVWFINMDEYLTEDMQLINTEDRLSFRRFMEQEVYAKLKHELIMPEEQRIFPNPSTIERIPDLIESLGGVDIAFGGIGINGHVAFNEPQSALSGDEFLQLKTRIQKISQETRAVNSIGDLHGAIEEMPTFCVTVGMYEIFHARKIRLGCFRDWHRAVVRRAAYGEKATTFPVSLLQKHHDINIKLTKFVAKLK